MTRNKFYVCSVQFSEISGCFRSEVAEPVASEGCYEHRLTVEPTIEHSSLFCFGVSGNSAAMVMFV